MANGDERQRRWIRPASLTPHVFVRVRIEYGWFVADSATKGYFQQWVGSHLAGERKVSYDRPLASCQTNLYKKVTLFYVVCFSGLPLPTKYSQHSRCNSSSIYQTIRNVSKPWLLGIFCYSSHYALAGQ